MAIISLLKRIAPHFLFNFYHFCLAFLGSIIYGNPSKRLKVVGVTGTNGKTTVVNMAVRILEEAGFKVASLSSIEFKVGKKEWPNTLKMTMPGRFKIQKFLRQAVNYGCQYAVLEITSEGILQHRHKFIDFEAAVFTNLSPEHIERHGGFENYRAAKLKFFQAVKKIHIINIDDENSKYFLALPAEKKYTYGLKRGDVNSGNCPLSVSLMGDFNLYNGLAAVCFGLSQGIDLFVCQKAVEKIKRIPGRMEEVISRPFKVIVDYAFTPNALEKVYQTLQKIKNKKKKTKLVCLLGACGGGRDRWKRRVLGGIAAKYCDKLIITNEDPYDEEPMSIIKQVAEGAGEKPEKILDRRKAIERALKSAEPGDIVIITGKGCEPWICVKRGKKIPWDDRKVVLEEFIKI